MLIAIYRHAAAGFAEHVDDLLIEPIARIELLALFVIGIVAVLAYEDNCVHGEAIAAERERVANCRVDLEIMLRGEAAAQVVLRDMVRVHRDYPHGRLMALALVFVSLYQSAGDYVRVRVKAVLRNDGGHPLLRFGPGGPSQGGGGLQQIAAADHSRPAFFSASFCFKYASYSRFKAGS